MRSLTKKFLTGLLVVLFAGLAQAGCGVVATPYTFGKALASNRFTTFRGQIVNEKGEPVWYMTRLHVFYQRYGWNPFYWDATDNLERDVKPNWKGEFEFTLYHDQVDYLTIGISAPGYQSFWLASEGGQIWLEDSSGSYKIDAAIAFKAHPELKPTDDLRIVLQRSIEPHAPHVPTEASAALSHSGASATSP